MNYLSLLGSHLKSDNMLDFLEPYDIEVIYDFDRFHENTSDQYWVTIEELGLRLKFDENQILTDVFVFLDPEQGGCRESGLLNPSRKSGISPSRSRSL
jgi:hypothetical protein